MASVKSMHLTMQGQHQQMLHEMSGMSQQQMQQHCNQTPATETVDRQHISHQQHALHQSQRSHQQLDCMSGMSQQQMLQSHHCQDCSLSMCQSLITWLSIEALYLSAPLSSQAVQPIITDYQMRHLSGFWQQILRPPKA